MQTSVGLKHGFAMGRRAEILLVLLVACGRVLVFIMSDLRCSAPTVGAGRQGAPEERSAVLRHERKGAEGSGVLLPPGNTPLLLILPPGLPIGRGRYVRND